MAVRRSLSVLAFLCLASGLGCQRGEGRPPARPDDASDAPGARDTTSPERHQHHAMHEGDGSHHDHASHVHRGGHHRFEDAEAWAEVFDDPERDAWQKPDAVVDFMNLAPDATVADVGAGTGYFSVRIARRVPQGTVIATDIEPDMIRYLRARAQDEGLQNLVASQAGAHDPGLDRPVDVVFMCDVYHHLEDPSLFFGRVRERLAAGGRIIIVDFDPEAPEDAPGPPKAMRVSADHIVEQLRPLGLVESRRDTTTLPYQYILELKRSGKRLPAPPGPGTCVAAGESGCGPKRHCCDPRLFTCSTDGHCVPYE